MVGTFDEAFDNAWNKLNPQDDTAPEDGTAEASAGEPAPEAIAGQDADAETEDSGPEVDVDGDEDEVADETPEVEGIVVGEDDVIVLPDGSKVSVKDAALRQADYTKKTQAVADQRKELEERTLTVEAREVEVNESYNKLVSWVEERQADPIAWVEEIVATAAEPTAVIARALQGLAKAGRLSPDFVEAFGLESGPIAAAATHGEQQDRLSKVEQTLASEALAKEQARRQEQIVAEYRGQWETIKAENTLTFASPSSDNEAWVELVRFARDRQITHLPTAFAALQWEASRNKPAAPAPASVAAPDPKVSAKKRAAGAIAQRSAAADAAPVKAKTLDAAARRAVDAVFAQH